jgi:hypothetical protein
VRVATGKKFSKQDQKEKINSKDFHGMMNHVVLDVPLPEGRHRHK